MKSILESQLQVIRSSVNPDIDPQKRPFTRPSILFDAKEAADIDIDTLFNIALSGLEVLISHDERFANYKKDLFTHNSRELDRELLGIDQNNQINASISSYLRLLSGYFQLPSALRTLEYLIRRYKIHKYNMEELILCALPYHDTHVFVRIVQLLETGNGKWKFLDDVKTSGAPPPRKQIVQKCSSDVLVALRDYASPSKKIQPTRPVISFCTAVIIELYGSKEEIKSEDVEKILPYVRSCLQSHSKGNIDHKAGALMIIGLLANRSELHPDVCKSLMRPVAEVAREDAKHSTDLQLIRVSFMALVNIVQIWQRKSGEMLPKKVLDVLKEIRDLSGILCGLTKEFNIDKFLALLLESLMEYSPDDDNCHQMLLSMIKTVPINSLVERLVSKLLSTSKKLYRKGNEASTSGPGGKAKEILVSINDHYSRELRDAVQCSLQDIEMKSKRDGSAYDILRKVLDGGLDSSSALSDSRIWFGLEHPKARVRRATVASLDADLKLGDKSVNIQKLQTVYDALLRRLYDDDLSVVQAVLSMDRLSEFIKHLDFLDGLQKVLKRCISILNSKGSDDTTIAADVIMSCLEHVISSFQHQEEYAKELAALIFPLILVMPKSQSINLKALNAAKNLQWPLYQKVTTIASPEQKMAHRSTAALNMDNISVMAESFLANSDEYVHWFIGYCHDLDQSKTLFLLILLQSLMKPLKDFRQFSALYESCFPILIKEWEKLERAGFGASTEESNRGMVDRDCTAFLDQMYGMKVEELNAEIIICIFWRLLDSFIATAHEDVSKDDSEVILQNLFSFFASHSKVVYKMHLHYIVAKQKSSPARFLSSLFTDEGVAFSVQKESLHSFAFLCSQLEEGCRLKSEIDEGLLLQLPAEFPSLLVSLSSDDQEIRSAAMSCIEGLYALWPHISSSGGKNGRSAVWVHFLGELMAMMVQQKKLILSDMDFLFEFFTTLLSSTHHSLLVPKSVGDRFDRLTKDSILKFILGSALSLCPYGMLKVLSLLKGMGNVMLVKEVTSLLSDLLDRRGKSHQALSQIEVQILCLLLECGTKLPSTAGGQAIEFYMLKALKVDRSFPEDVSIIQPCVTVLRCLSSSLYGGLKPETQELFFQELVCLFRSNNGDIQNAARMALLQLKVSSSTIQRMLDFVLEKVIPLASTPHGKKKKQATTHLKSELHNDVDHKRCSKLSFLSSLLDILLLKIDIQNRAALVEPLFKHLKIIFMDKEWISEAVKQDEKHAEGYLDVSQTTSITICHVQQNLLSVLEDITLDILEARIIESFDIKLLVCCARSTDDAATRNHVFSLLSAVAKVVPDIILDHILDILAVMCESAVTQFDGHSKKVFEDLISTMVPHWLSKTKNQEELLQIFLNILPDISQHRRLPIVVHLLRTLGESGGLASIFVLLFRSLASKYEHLSTSLPTMWEYTFALQISEQYSCIVWLPSLLTMLQKLEMGTWDQRLAVQLLVAMQFISEKLQDPEVAFKLKSREDVDTIQATTSALMEHVATYLQLVGSSRKEHDVPTSVGRKLKELLHDVLASVRKGLLPSSFFDVIIKLLGNADCNLRKKGLGLLCDMAKECSMLTQKHNKRVLNPSIRSSWLRFDELTLQSFESMCHEILKIVDDSNTSKHGSLRLSAVSTLEVLVTVFPTCDSSFNICLSTVIKHIHSEDLGVSSGCFRTVGALINVLGPRALPELPSIMENVFQRCHAVSLSVNLENQDTGDISLSGSSSSKESLFMSILVTMEAVIEKLGGFLNPYLGKVLELVILHPLYANNSNTKLKLKADGVRNIITEKVPVRLALPPLLRIYSEAIKSGDSGLSITFQMLGNLISKMDRSSISTYYLNIFDMCLLALDLRRQNPASVKNITAVEKDVINAMVALTMKLTENMFKPLFIRCVEWSEFVEHSEDLAHADIDRAISFFSLIHKLIDSHRSLFVPYFKYILNGLVRHLTDEVERPGPTRKKARLVDLDIIKSREYSSLSIGKWHVRALVISSLHKCFVHDKDRLEFLDSSNFQMLLKPIISQLGVDPPSSLEQHPDVPNVNEVDDMLISCVGQMAVTSASDLLWKPLNHEVLMQTRSEKVRTRILGLKIVKYLVENLREEYMVFLPETIPFLGELLEDVEPNVKSLAQEILKEMETTSGESLRQYL
uniref:uncharacterized protein At3g06530 isoform X2 n=1 Tax=Erigeron canadensis TaxID=72917 RepID=UPI001CB92910|nr:uncharacterized protein At3g06530 isoform X2 [Erigeron canadensis]